MGREEEGAGAYEFESAEGRRFVVEGTTLSELSKGEKFYVGYVQDVVAAELRRLHSEIQRMQEDEEANHGYR